METGDQNGQRPEGRRHGQLRGPDCWAVGLEQLSEIRVGKPPGAPGKGVSHGAGPDRRRKEG